MEKRPPGYLSASRLTCYAYCPAEFYKRYILGHDEPPTYERLFGIAVHKGFEALFKNEDAELAFLQDWRAAKQTLAAAQQPIAPGLDNRGLEILEMVSRLGLTGEPERWISVLHPEISLPFIGYVDLWDSESKTIYDFKTTGFGWTQNKADAQVFQPAIYSQAFADAYGYIPRFQFIVISRSYGAPKVFDGTRTGDQIIQAFGRAKDILSLIEAEVFGCTCGRHEGLAA